jgi:nitrogen regulatory protein PII
VIKRVRLGPKGKIWATEVTKIMRVRTSEVGEDAV